MHLAVLATKIAWPELGGDTGRRRFREGLEMREEASLGPLFYTRTHTHTLSG